MRRIAKILGITLLICLLLIVVGGFLLSRAKVQNYIADKAANYIEERIDSKVEIGDVKIDFLNRVHLKQFYVEDQQKDTLAYLGDLVVSTSSIINDFWNDETPVFNSVTLKDGVVRLHRLGKSKRWNYSFIEDAFASKDKDTTSSGEAPRFDLKDISAERVSFSMLDEYAGQDIKADIGELDININEFKPSEKTFSIGKINLENSDVVFEEYAGTKKTVPNRKIDKSQWGTPFNPDKFLVGIQHIEIDAVDFMYRRDKHQSKAGLFDERHIVAKNLHTDIKEVRMHDEELTASIKNLSVKERSGLRIKALQANVKLTQQIAELKDLFLQTNHSEVKDYFSMSYSNFHDFNDFIGAVNMRANFKTSSIDKRDIAFFAGDIDQLPLVTRISGKVEGTVANLYGKDLKAAGGGTSFAGDVRITGLPDVTQTYFDIKANELRTSGQEVLRFAPEAKNDAIRWNNLNQVNFAGTFKGTTQTFGVDGDIKTNYGNARVDMAMDFTKKVSTYVADVQTQNLQLDKIINQSEVGAVSVNGIIKGQGFDINSINTSVDAKVSSIVLQGEKYEDINVNGLFSQKQFSGEASSNDKNLGFVFSGKADFNKENPSYDFKSDILRLNLKSFGLTEENTLLTAKANLDFNGNNIDDFNGKAILKDIIVRSGEKQIKLPYFELTSFNTDQFNKVLDLKSSAVDATVKGQYALSSIPNAVQAFLHYYLPTYIEPVRLKETENFTFNVQVKEANDVIAFFEEKLKVGAGTVLSGQLNSQGQELIVNGNIPYLRFRKYELQDITLKTNGNYGLLDINVQSNQLKLGSDGLIQDASLGIQMSNDTAHLRLETNPTTDVLGPAILECKATAHVNDIQVDILPSSFIIEDDRWVLSSEYPVLFTKDQELLAKEVFIQNGTQRLAIDAIKDLDKNNVIVELTNLDLERLSAYLNTEPRVFKARVNSHVEINDIWGQTKIAGNAKSMNHLRINNDTIGVVDLRFDYDVQEQILKVNEGTSILNKSSFVKTNGAIDFIQEKLNLAATMDKTSIAVLNQFLAGTVDSLEGFASGNVVAKGTFSSPVVTGKLSLDDTKLKVVFTGCGYDIDKINLALNNNEILFDPVKIYDRRSERGEATLSGRITHKDFDKYRLKLRVQSDDLLSLNTDESSGELFYGKIQSKVDMRINGTLNDITMSIDAKPLKDSKFFLPISSSGDVGSYDYIKFKEVGRLQEQKKEIAQNTYFKIKMNIAATPDIEAYIVLDPNTGEEIIAKGNGNIKLLVDLGNEIEMYNKYTIKEGKYLFNFRGLLKKEFDLEEGGTITWNGDPFNANLDLGAVYNTKVALYPLISNEVEAGLITDESEIREAQNANNTAVKIDLKGGLSAPSINFGISQPDNRDVGSLAMSRLQSIQKDPNELIYQSGMILLFNSFKPIQGGVNANNLISATGASTASDVIGSALSPILNNVINKLTGTDNLSVNLNYKNYSSDVSAQGTGANHNQVNIGLTGKLFNDKVRVYFGNSFDIANTNATGNNLTYGGDFRAQYLITPDGRWRADAFRVSNYDYVENRPIAKGGVGFTYKKVFNHWKDLFVKPKTTKVIKDGTTKVEDNKKVDSTSTP